jgi:Kef-type K+ transport system membrane component KefB
MPLGFDLIVFLGSTVLLVPAAKRFNVSPVLAFLAAGVVLHQFG